MRVGRAAPWWVLSMLLAVPGGASEPRCSREDALAEAAASLMLDGGAPGDAAVLRAVRESGSDLPAAHALWVPPEGHGAVRRWMDELRERSDAPLACGRATSGNEAVVLAAPRGGRLEVATGGVRVELAEGFGEAYLALQDAGGDHRRLALEEDAGSTVVPLPPGLEPPVTVQLVATGPAGPRPVAIRVVGAPRAGGSGSAPSPDGDASLDDRLGDLRALHGAGSLRPNRLLAEAAHDHARRVCESRRVAHALGPGDDPEARLAKRGLRARVVGEVVARDRRASDAFAALTESPSHRLTMVDPRFTDVGLGRARDDAGKTCLVIVFAAWPTMAW
ncbi:MAG: CAP domain-containing protein [Myxococcota bacterium]